MKPYLLLACRPPTLLPLPSALPLPASHSPTCPAGAAGFTHFSYVLPSGLRDTCGWVGLAELPGTQTWYTPDNQVGGGCAACEVETGKGKGPVNVCVCVFPHAPHH